MRDRRRVGVPDPAAALPVDPFADLLFTMIAAVLPAILLLAPMLHRPTSKVPPDRSAPRSPATPVTVDGNLAHPIIAGANGLRLTGPQARQVGLDEIADDADLAQRLEVMRTTGEPLLLVVEPDGLESAFLFEPVVAAHGPAVLRQVRAEQRCDETTDRALAAACGDEPVRHADPR